MKQNYKKMKLCQLKRHNCQEKNCHTDSILLTQNQENKYKEAK